MSSSFAYQDDLTEATEERNNVAAEGLPSEGQLVLLCLDFLRDLRRSYNKEDLALAEGIDADHLSMAIYSLSRAFLRPQQLVFSRAEGNDAWMDRSKANILAPGSFPTNLGITTKLPDLATINREILYSRNPNAADAEPAEFGSEDDDDWYKYDDAHGSNTHRFYGLKGLATGLSSKGPLTLGEIAAAGLAGLEARSRLDAEREMIQSPLFEQFIGAVQAKGFFRDPDTEQPKDDPEEERERQRKATEIYNDRYRKVVAKFRTKLVTKAMQDGQVNNSTVLGASLSGNLLALSAVDRQQRRRVRRTQLARTKKRTSSQPLSPMAEVSADGTDPEGGSNVASYSREVITPERALLASPEKSIVSSLSKKLAPQSPSVRLSKQNPIDLEEAERLKAQGNNSMQKKEYQVAADAYTAALKLSPAGPQSHVYFSNRAAALLSMKRFDEAILDSERSLALKPDYGKAHARLGLAHFLLGNYRQALEAYTVSLKYEPDNKSSQSYLAKATKRLAKQEGDDEATSFSIVSEWDKSEAGRTHGTVMDLQAERRRLVDEKEAERFKTKGNNFMANRDYKSALEAYSCALELCPNGELSHVYFSNRAAALCYLERYEEAEHDSEQSLALNPTYGKAHARLGLSRFFMGDYEGAVEAYTRALQYDPDNAASKSYLQKAKARVDRSVKESSVSETSISDAPTPDQVQRRNDTSIPVQDQSTKTKLSASKQDVISSIVKQPVSEGAAGFEGTNQRLTNDPERRRMAADPMADPSMIDTMMI